MLEAKSLTFVTSLVSKYSHNIASSDTRGMDARSAAIKELRFAISDIATIKKVVSAILMM